MPATANSEERLLRGGELGELGLAQRHVAECELPVESRERVSGQEPARPERLRARRYEIDLEAGGRRDPARGQEHRHALLLESGDRIAQEKAHSVVVEHDYGRALVVEGDSTLFEDRLDRLQSSRQHRRGSLARTKEKTSAPPVQSSAPGGRASGRLQPGAGSSSTMSGRGVGINRAALVETEADRPRSGRASRKSLVDPLGQPLLEGGIPARRRQLGVERCEPVEQVRDRRRTRHRAASDRSGRRRRAVARARCGRPRRRRGRRRRSRRRRRTPRRRSAASPRPAVRAPP